MDIKAVIKLIEALRGENGCPWDRQQTPSTLSMYLVEEMYELLEAIESDDSKAVCEELGDVLFHILFIACIYRERGSFDVQDIVDLNTGKMIRRHPHVFGSDKVDTAEEVRSRWHQIKRQEQKHALKASVLDSVPRKLPALMRAYRISERAAKIGFDWSDIEGVMEKVEEEWEEFKTAIIQKGEADERPERVALEFGDILFTLVNVARFARIHPETALSGATRKFLKRFKHMEKTVSKEKKNLENLTNEEMQNLWEHTKKTIG